MWPTGNKEGIAMHSIKNTAAADNSDEHKRSKLCLLYLYMA